MKIAISGAAGLQGSHLGEYLLESGHQVHGVDNYSRGTYRADWIHTCELRDQHDEGFKYIEGVDVVFHLAAQVWGAAYSKSHNWEMFTHNAQVDQNVLRACVEGGVKRVIYPSTACIYPVELQNRWDSVLRENMDWGGGKYGMGPHPESGYG